MNQNRSPIQFQEQTTKFRVKLNDSRIIEIVCNPFNLKKEILKQETGIQCDNLLIILNETQNIISGWDYQTIAAMQQQNVIIEVKDANLLLKYIQALKQQNLVMNSQLENQQLQLNQKEEQIKELKSQIENQVQDFQNKLCHGEHNLQMLQESHREEIYNLKKVYDSEQKDFFMEKEKQIQCLNNNIQGLQQSLKENQQQQINIKSQFEQQMQQQIQENSLALDSLNQQWQQYYQQSIQEKYGENQELRNIIMNLRDQKDDLHAKKHELERNIDNLIEQIKYKQQQIDLLRAQLISQPIDIDRETDNILGSPAEQENRELRRQVLVLEQKLNDSDNLHQNLKQTLNTKLQEAEQRLTQERNNDKNQIQQLLEDHSRKSIEIANLINNKEFLSNQIAEKQRIIQDDALKITSLQEQNSKLDQEINTLNRKIQEILPDLKNQKDQVQQLTIRIEEQLKEMSAQNEQQSDIKRQLDQANHQITTQENRIHQLEQYINDQRQHENILQQNIRDLQTQILRSQDDQCFQDKVIKKVLQEQSDRYTENIISPIEKLSKLTFGIKNFQDDPNLQRDDTEYDVFEITLDQKKALELMKSNKDSYIFLEECLEFTDRGQIKSVRSIQPNVDATFVKGYIIKIEQATYVELPQKTLLRKEFKQQQTQYYSNKVSAAKQSMNNLMCKFLLDKFNDDLRQCKLNHQPFDIQRQFVLKIKGKEEYLYCEMIKDGNFEKINLGEFNVNSADLHQYINCFALYIMHLMKKELILSNFQVLGKYLHDMIVSTKKFKFSTLDQGQIEIQKITDKLEKMTRNRLQAYWNNDLENIAQKGL